MPPAALEELYTSTFDLEPACTPYLGVQLLGDENPVRGMLLAKLVELYAAEGFQPREELADHVAEVLGFLAVAQPGTARDDLVLDGLVPALGKMIEGLGDRENPYREVLTAVREIFPATAVEPVNAAVNAPVPVPGFSPFASGSIPTAVAPSPRPSPPQSGGEGGIHSTSETRS
jgi:nitrate reductase delta subunit